MSRAQKLQILASMDDQVLSNALSSVGIACEGEDYTNDKRPDVDEQLENWNSRRVPFGEAKPSEPLWHPQKVLQEKPSTPTHLGFKSNVEPASSAGDYGMYAEGDL